MLLPRRCEMSNTSLTLDGSLAKALILPDNLQWCSALFSQFYTFPFFFHHHHTNRLSRHLVAPAPSPWHVVHASWGQFARRWLALPQIKHLAGVAGVAFVEVELFLINAPLYVFLLGRDQPSPGFVVP